MSSKWLRTWTSPAGLGARRRRQPRPNAYRLVLEKLESRIVLSSSIPLNTANWVDLGPAPITSGQIPGGGNVSGRVTGLSADPTNAKVIYAASAGGGIWRTVNGGQSWNPLTDHVTDASGQPVPQFMGSVAVAPSNPQIVYAGTGEADNSGDSFYGEGVLVSTNGGTTWTLTGQAQLNGLVTSRIAVDPLNSSRAYAAVSDRGMNGKSGGTTGIYETTDRGLTWTNVTQAAGLSTTDAYSDILFDPSTSSTTAVLYAAIGNPGGANANGVYKSRDGGATWGELLSLPRGTPDGRIALALSHPAGANQTTLYASIESTATGGLLKLERSVDGGLSWIDLTPNLGGDDYLQGQGNYDNVVAADPNNPGLVYVAGVLANQGPVNFSGGGVLESTDYGQSWSEINVGTAANNGPHTDYHALIFDAAGRLVVGNDGGVWRLDSNDMATPNIAWTDLNTNLEITQFTSVALSPNGADGAYAGSQDNGTEIFSDSRSWVRNRSGDGGIVRVDPNNFQTLYHTYSYPPPKPNLAFFEESDSLPTFWYENDTGISRTDPANFYPPFVLDPNNTKRLLLGTDQLYEELHDDTGWHPFGKPLPSTASNIAIDAIAFAPSDSSTIYVTAGNNVFVTNDNGQTWAARTPVVSFAGELAPSYRFLGLAIDPSNANTAYVATSIFTSNGKGEVWRTTDGGKNWVDITGSGLPNGPVNTIALLPVQNRIYVGTDVGVYGTSTADGAKTVWSRVGGGMPNVQVVDLETATYPGQQAILAAATYGRGLWEISVPYSIPITFFNVPTSPVEGSTFKAGTLATFSDANPIASLSDLTAVVNWGDGTSVTLTAANGGIHNNFNGTFSVIGGPHTYFEESDDSTFSIVVTDRSGGSGSRSAPITIVGYTASFSYVMGDPVGVKEGITTGLLTLGILTATGSAEELAELTASVSWGDGTTDTLTPANGGIVTYSDGTIKLFGEHTYAEEGLTQSGLDVFVASATSASGTVNVPFEIQDAPLAILSTNLPPSPVVGVNTGSLNLGVFADGNLNSSADEFTATVNWGDQTTTTLTAANGGIVQVGFGEFRLVSPHTYSDGGILFYSVSIKDEGGATIASQPALLVVSFPAPVLTGASPSSVNAGSGDLSVTLTGSGFTLSTYIEFSGISGVTLAYTNDSPTQLTATIPAAYLRFGVEASITAINPGPGGGSSIALPFVVRNVPPTAGRVYDGSAAGVETASQSSTTSLSANWAGFIPGTYGITDFRWSIGTQPGLSDVYGPADVRLATSATATGLNLTAGASYYVTVTATDIVGLTAVASSSGVLVDSVPLVTKVGSTDPDGLYGLGAVIAITVTYSVPVLVSGQPVLLLSDGAEADYISGGGTKVVTFAYLVALGQTTGGAHLDLQSASPLSLRGGSITNLSGTQAASPVFPVPGLTGSLGADDAIVIDAASTPLTLGPIPPAVDVPVDAEDVTFSVNVDPRSLSTSELNLTLNGGPNLITSAVRIVAVMGDTYQILGLAGLTSNEGTYVLTFDEKGVTTPAGVPLYGSASVAWITDTTAPTSKVQPLPGTAPGATFTVTALASDMLSGGVASGVEVVAIYVSDTGAPLAFWRFVTPASPSASFSGVAGHTYGFQADAEDLALNLESKKAFQIDATTYVPFTNQPITTLTAAPVSASPTINLTLTGSDPGGPGLAVFKVYLEIDQSTTMQLVATIPAGTPDGSGNFHAAYAYPALADGQSHAYRFFSVGIDAKNNVEPPHANPDATVTATFASDGKVVEKLVVDHGGVGRSFVRYVDVIFGNGASSPATLIAGNRIRLVVHNLDGTGGTNVPTPAGVLSVVNGQVEFDFGPNGIGSLQGAPNADSTIGDGYYEIQLDLDGSGNFATSEFFYRILGDVNGDRTVDATDIQLIGNAIPLTGALLMIDFDGSGQVTATDRTLAQKQKAKGVALGPGLRLDG